MPKAQPIRPSTTIVPTHQVIAHPPVFKIFDLAQIAGGFRDERRPARCLLMSALPPKADIDRHEGHRLFPANSQD